MNAQAGELVTRHMNHQTHNRRTILATGAAAAGTAAVAACGADGQPTTPATGYAPGPPAPAGQALAQLSDVPPGEARSVAGPDGHQVIVSRPDETTVAGFSSVCTHMGCTVTPQGTQLRCPCHGSVFDAFTGRVKNGPATSPLPAIPVKIENDRIVTANP